MSSARSRTPRGWTSRQPSPLFVRHTPTDFQPYKVKLGVEQDSFYLVESGLPAGETIVTEGAFLLKTELLKGSIGAGCCEVDPGANR